MKALELKMPPLGVLLIAAIGMRLLANLTPALSFSWPGYLVMSIALLGASLFFGAGGVIALLRTKTTTSSTHLEAVSVLVTEGVYRYSRNPMYFALFLILAAWAVYLLHALAFVFLALFIGFMNFYQIIPEERVLAEKFGERYAEYRKSVPRWI